MKRKLGEIQQINGKWYQLVKADKNNSCNGCSFFLSDNGKDCIIRCRNYGLIYKKLKIGGVPYSRDGKTYQAYIVPYTPYFYNGEYYACQAFDSRYFIAEINKEDMKENEENKYDGKMDKECIPLCDALNSLPDVETTESCCGHCKDRFMIFLTCDNPHSLAITARVFDRRYISTSQPWYIELQTKDNGAYDYFIHSETKYDSEEVMMRDINQIIENIKYWRDDKFTSYFKGYDDKPTLVPFDIDLAKQGKPVCTRDGRKARIICFDKDDKDNMPIVALVYKENESVCLYYEDGRQSHFNETKNDLMMFPEKKEGWVNVYYDNDASSHRSCKFIYDTEEHAIEAAGERCITTIKIEWEE